MLEDGYEIDNVFERNLGAHLKKPSRVLMNVDHTTENDRGPSVFWIMSPMNHWSVSLFILSNIFALTLLFECLVFWSSIPTLLFSTCSNFG